MKRAVGLQVLMLLGCGPSAEDYSFVRTEHCPPDCDAGARDAGPTDAGPPVIPDEPLEPWDTADAGPLTGIFAAEVIVTAKVVIDIEARQLYRIRLLQRGTELRMRTQACRISLPAVAGVAELTIPPALERVLQTKGNEVEGPYLSMEDPVGAAFRPPSAVIILGADLSDPMLDLLPTQADPSRALDEDADGHPGVTVDATTVLCRNPERAYVALRAVALLDGIVEDTDTIAGTVSPLLDQSVLGVSHNCLAPAAELVIEIRPGSTFRALRVADAQDWDGNGNVSCPEIALHAADLFGDYWMGR